MEDSRAHMKIWYHISEIKYIDFSIAVQKFELSYRQMRYQSVAHSCRLVKSQILLNLSFFIVREDKYRLEKEENIEVVMQVVEGHLTDAK
jgi:hypothetical protein